MVRSGLFYDEARFNWYDCGDVGVVEGFPLHGKLPVTRLVITGLRHIYVMAAKKKKRVSSPKTDNRTLDDTPHINTRCHHFSAPSLRSGRTGPPTLGHGLMDHPT